MSQQLPGEPPGNSAGPAGPGIGPYPLIILIVLAIALVIFVGIAIWIGSLAYG